MENYHKHTYYSNMFSQDSSVSYEQYAKRAVELGQHVLCSVEHGWQGKYHECREVAIKYGLKFVFGTEAYWVKDRHEKDNSNCHIVLLAKNENGRQCINEILSTANEDGYYYRPRVDMELLLSLPPDDILVTTACLGFWVYMDSDDIVRELHDHFGTNFYLEIQNHNTVRQKALNQHIKELSDTLGIPMIVGLDSHYIFPEQSVERDELLQGSKVKFNDSESDWYMDYPDEDTVRQRFREQGVLSEEDVEQAMRNTEVLLSFEDYVSPVFTKDRKLPTLYPDYTQEQKNKLYSKLITKLYREFIKTVPESERQRYYEGVKMEVDTYKETGMVDYPLIDYAIVKRGIEKGGVVTNTGRGSAVGYFTNTLCGFSKVDRFKSPIKLYPERFISKTRIMETNSLPDIDLNVSAQEPFEEAQAEILGQDHAYPMIAFGTLKKKAAFKMYARAKNLDLSIANKISNQISRYDEALKYADDDERDTIDIYDFVDEEYHDYLTKSKVYWGIVNSKSKAPCAYLLYQGSIRREIGLIKCKSITSKKEYITTVIDGGVAENYKFLKNDWLIVDTVYLTDSIFKRIGMKPLSVDELCQSVDGDESVWRLYAEGYTLGINQCEKPNAVKRLKRYKPKNISELSAFVAAIRPGFKSMYERFESRAPFSYGISILDDAIQTEQFPYSYILYQETLMSVLNLAGFPMDECYGIIKAIAKKHPEKVRPLKARFIEGFKEKIRGQCQEGQTEAQVAEDVWKIISDSTAYSFNSAHAYSMALDSLYNAWQKAHYPYEFYEVLLQRFSDKGNKDKVAALKREMKTAFGIDVGPMEWGADNRTFHADKNKHCIYPSLLSIKGLNKSCAYDLYELYRRKSYKDFTSLLKDIKEKTKINSAQLETLIKLDYFHAFGNPNQLLKIADLFTQYYEVKQLSKEKMEPLIPHERMLTLCEKETAKRYINVDWLAIVGVLASQCASIKTPVIDRIRYEQECLGYLQLTIPTADESYVFVQAVEGKFSNKTLSLYQLKTGETITLKVKGRTLESSPIEPGEILKTITISEERKWGKTADGEWFQKEETELILKKYSHVRAKGGEPNRE